MVVGSTHSHGGLTAVASADVSRYILCGLHSQIQPQPGSLSLSAQACDGTDCSPQEDLLDSQAPAAAAYPGQPTAVTAVEAATAAAEAPGSAEAPVPTAEPEAQRMLQTQVHPLRGSGNTLEDSETGSYILTPHKPSHPWP